MTITLGEALNGPGAYDTWPVLLNGTDTGAVVYETTNGYRFNWPGSTTDPLQHIGQVRPFREGAREDAEEWFRKRNA